jgi:hypothetical protein
VYFNFIEVFATVKSVQGLALDLDQSTFDADRPSNILKLVKRSAPKRKRLLKISTAF